MNLSCFQCYFVVVASALKAKIKMTNHLNAHSSIWRCLIDIFQYSFVLQISQNAVKLPKM